MTEERKGAGPRIAHSRGQADDWSLVLTAAGIAHRLERTAEGWALHVAWRDEERVDRHLEAYRQESAARLQPDVERPEYGRSHAGFALAGALVLFYLVTGPREASVSWFRAGSASADLILAGELWRTVTALTLHADAAHIMGNAASCAIFVTALSRLLGPGIAAWLLLLAGGLGNGVTAIAHASRHSAVGASTALFGAVGSLAGIQFVTWRRRVTRTARAWVPLAAGLALLAMLGTGQNADIAAHFFGFVAGTGLGVLTARGLGRPPGPLVQWPLALAATGTVLACWGIALR